MTSKLNSYVGATPTTRRDCSRIARQLYHGDPRFAALRQQLRPRICPFHELTRHVPPGARVLDVGCGGGLLLGLLASTSQIESGVGFDADAAAIAQARRMAARAGLSSTIHFEHIDVKAAWPAGTFDVVSVIDVMHHIPPEHQRNVLRMAAQKVAEGGLLLYKDMVSIPRWRALANRLHDLLMTRERIWYMPRADVEGQLTQLGFALETYQRLDQLWYGHELFCFRSP